MKKRDLKLAAFIVSAGTTLFFIPLIFPLAWMIPMTVHIWKAYKKELRITPRFIICATIFLINPVISILLLFSENYYTRRKWIYYIALLETIVFGLLIFPLAWMIPMTIRYYRASNGEYNPGLAFKIVTILFFGPLPLTLGYVKGLLLLTERVEPPCEDEPVYLIENDKAPRLE